MPRISTLLQSRSSSPSSTAQQDTSRQLALTAPPHGPASSFTAQISKTAQRTQFDAVDTRIPRVASPLPFTKVLFLSTNSLTCLVHKLLPSQRRRTFDHCVASPSTSATQHHEASILRCLPLSTSGHITYQPTRLLGSHCL